MTLSVASPLLATQTLPLGAIAMLRGMLPTAISPTLALPAVSNTDTLSLSMLTTQSRALWPERARWRGCSSDRRSRDGRARHGLYELGGGRGPIAGLDGERPHVNTGSGEGVRDCRRVRKPAIARAIAERPLVLKRTCAGGRRRVGLAPVEAAIGATTGLTTGGGDPEAPECSHR